MNFLIDSVTSDDSATVDDYFESNLAMVYRNRPRPTPQALFAAIGFKNTGN